MCNVSYEKFEEGIIYLRELDDKIDEIIKIVGGENKITEALFDCHDKICDGVMELFGDNEIIHDYISWWIYDCNFGEDNAEVYDADTHESTDDLSTTKLLYDYIMAIYVADGTGNDQDTSGSDCNCNCNNGK